MYQFSIKNLEKITSMKNNFESTLVVIPARGGSKRIPNKNIKTIFGQPMIYWPLMALNKLFRSCNILVSTDSRLIKTTIEATGLKVPFKRPANISDDFATTSDVIIHALNWFESNVRKVKYVLTVYPTAVLLSEEDIVSAMKKLKKDNKADSVMSATYFQFPIQRAIYQNSKGYLDMFQPENYIKRSQDLIKTMHDAGQFYLSKSEAIRKGVLFTNSKVKPLILHPSKVIDIDTLEDFDLAEEKLRLYKSNKKFKSLKFSD